MEFKFVPPLPKHIPDFSEGECDFLFTTEYLFEKAANALRKAKLKNWGTGGTGANRISTSDTTERNKIAILLMDAE